MVNGSVEIHRYNTQKYELHDSKKNEKKKYSKLAVSPLLFLSGKKQTNKQKQKLQCLSLSRRKYT